eukprot:CAMPEP_0169288336 /NCGR_PEP_ID=MMETSP1016-20121227/60496_1 /TAXON_ID=342587 /ORGANISM="Karlodinium micrum, Strain CCMP2283" /LENGTH=88 /DNA_ID=CAMNT_0009378541 /DNA_START=478 /DNA_END=744 /DNA_ORIENTATION=-
MPSGTSSPGSAFGELKHDLGVIDFADTIELSGSSSSSEGAHQIQSLQNTSMSAEVVVSGLVQATYLFVLEGSRQGGTSWILNSKLLPL